MRLSTSYTDNPAAQPARRAPDATRPANTPRAARAARAPLALGLFALLCAACALTFVCNSRAAAPQTDARTFAKFKHTDNTHARLPCLLCHRRESNTPQPKLPGHTPCAGCHAQQFNDTTSPVCAICHTDTKSGAVKSFPRLQSFDANFNHARHQTGAARPAADCAACHRPERRGVALSIPTGVGAHATCYQCHTPRATGAAGQDISSCATCHTTGRPTRTPTNAPAYRVNFSHARHGRAQRLACADCHNVRAAQAAARQISAPTPLMHHAPARSQSCMTCHNGRRAFGGDDFTACKRCHTGPFWHF